MQKNLDTKSWLDKALEKIINYDFLKELRDKEDWEERWQYFSSNLSSSNQRLTLHKKRVLGYKVQELTGKDLGFCELTGPAGHAYHVCPILPITSAHFCWGKERDSCEHYRRLKCSEQFLAERSSIGQMENL